MLGLRPRLRARNSLWDLVNQHHIHYTSSEPLPQAAVPIDGGVDDLPPLPATPRPPSPVSESESSPSPAASPSPTMAPVRNPKAIRSNGRQANQVSTMQKDRKRQEAGEEQYGTLFYPITTSACPPFARVRLLLPRGKANNPRRINLLSLRVSITREDNGS